MNFRKKYMENFCEITKKKKKNLIIMEIKCYLTEKRNIPEILLPENSVHLRKHF